MLSDSVEIYDSVSKMNSIPGNPDNTLHKEYMVSVGLFGWLVENNDIATPDVSVAHERDPPCSRSQRLALDHYVIADKQRTRHGRRGDNEVLKYKGDDEKPDRHYAACRRKSLKDCLPRLAVLFQALAPHFFGSLCRRQLRAHINFHFKRPGHILNSRV
jgi:hypothetical protein